jgi:hypothetical protein
MGMGCWFVCSNESQYLTGIGEVARGNKIGVGAGTGANLGAGTGAGRGAGTGAGTGANDGDGEIMAKL